MPTQITGESAKILRKNFTMSSETAQELDFLAFTLGKSRSQIIQDLIHKESEMRRNKVRLAKLKEMKGMFTGKMDEHSIQAMKSGRDL